MSNPMKVFISDGAKGDWLSKYSGNIRTTTRSLLAIRFTLLLWIAMSWSGTLTGTLQLADLKRKFGVILTYLSATSENEFYAFLLPGQIMSI